MVTKEGGQGFGRFSIIGYFFLIIPLLDGFQRKEGAKISNS